ncbi:MAG TPA: thiol reductant ABC exporter subunit CydC [Acidimicrobiales bacterium]|nr:thiol reductant ABC exporter subunit CydC [Acidimicrobiales bacterium]
MSASDTRAPIRRTLGVARPAAGRLALATALGAGAIAAAIGLMGTSAWLISRAAQHPPESELGLAIVGVQFFGLSRGFFRYGERLVGHDAAFRVLADLRVRVYRRLESLAPVGLPAFRSGDLLARLVDDVDSLQDVILRVVPPFVIAVVVGAVTVGVVWWLLPGAGAVLLVALLVAATVVPWLTASLARRSEARQASARGELAASVVDLLDGAADLAAFGATGMQLERIAAGDRELTAIASSAAGTGGIGIGLTTLLAGLAMWGSLVVGIPAVGAGRLAGVALAVVVLIPLAAFELVVGLPAATQALQRARAAAGRVFAVADAPPVVEDPQVPATAPGPPLELVARGVRARYPGAEVPAVDGVDLVLAPGRRLALVGPSGAGKSALAAVLLRFLPYEAGSVTLGGVELAELAGDDVRARVGLVSQDAHLFDTTLAENLRIGRREATDEELGAVLERVGLGDWLAHLPDGLGTEVGERGTKLSGGQRQRVAVARALLADFDILVLDEPAEHLDPEAADAITTDLLAITAGRATLLITHRLVGLKSIDGLCVIEQGRIVERGSYRDLVAAEGRFAELRGREESPG